MRYVYSFIEYIYNELNPCNCLENMISRIIVVFLEIPYCKKSNVPLLETKFLYLLMHCTFGSYLSLIVIGIEQLSKHAYNIIE